ncbi:MAG: anti-sigma factor [Actinomycetota bacterium]
MTGLIREEPVFDGDDIRELARSIEPHDFERIAPPPMVWNNILAEFEVETASSEADARRQARQSARPSGRTLMAIAAAALLLVGVLGGLTLRGDDAGEDLRELAAASMTDVDLPVPTDETAQARVVCDDDVCSVAVDLTGLPDSGDADLELWVINGDVTDMYSLGFVTEANGTFELPFGVTPTDYPIVDISIEPRDGVEAHSGQSVLRGVFDAT